jgi:Rps23 Pro-64 3,4-dihydroxylase Tpa1-like proline 4-hydroxylase
MENIKVYDNFLKENEIKRVVDIISSKKWSWGHTSDKTITPTLFWTMDLKENEYFTVYLKNVIEKHFSKKFKINRVYANAQTYGQDGNFHVDDESPNAYTVTLYISDIDKELIDTIGGYISFKLPNKTYLVNFEPYYNRCVFFPSNYLHRGSAFCRYCMELRICIAWKLEEICE